MGLALCLYFSVNFFPLLPSLILLSSSSSSFYIHTGIHRAYSKYISSSP